MRRWQRAEVCCCIVAFQCCCCPLLAAGHHECWSLNGQNRLGAHEWPGGGHLLVLLRRKPQHSSPTQAGRYPSSRFWLSVGELSGLPMLPGLPGMIAPSGSGQVQPCVVAAW